MKNMEIAEDILEENICSTRDVTEWANLMGFDTPRNFSNSYRKHFGLRPIEVLIEISVRCIMEYIHTFPNEKMYCVALEYGFENEGALYKFIKRHTGKSITQLKSDNEIGCIKHLLS